MEAHGISLCYFHGFEIMYFSSFSHPVFSVIQEMAYVSDIAHVPDLVSGKCQVSVYHIETDKSTAIAHMNVAVHRRTTHIHAGITFLYGFKNFFLPGKAIINLYLSWHVFLFYRSIIIWQKRWLFFL